MFLFLFFEQEQLKNLKQNKFGCNSQLGCYVNIKNDTKCQLIIREIL